MQIRNAYSPIRYPYYEITQGYGGTTLGINSSWESVGFGRSVRAERTGSPSGRTKDKLSEDERFGKLIDDNAGSNGDIHGVFRTQLGNLQATI